MRARLIAVAVVALLLPFPAASTAAIIHVPGDQPTIQEGIEAAAEGDTVVVAHDTYTGPLNRDLDFGGVSMLLVSEDERVDTVIDCEGAGRGFHFSTGEDTTLVIQGFTVTNAVGDSGAGAKCINGSSPKFVDCTFSGNASVDFGGAVMCRASSPVIVGCVFDGNEVTGGTYPYGGAVACVADADPRIAGCIFTGNTAGGFAGALYCGGHSSPRVTECTFSDNVSMGSSGGGAVFCVSYSEATFTDCEFTGNVGTQGGAIYTQSAHIAATRCRFAGNHARAIGGAVRFLYGASTGTLTDCTFAGNTSASLGGAFACAFDANALITGCTFVGNGSGGGGGTLDFNDASPTVENAIIAFGTDGGTARCQIGTEMPVFSYCVVFGNVEGDDLCGSVGDTMLRDPRFCDMPGGDYSLCANSPCLAVNNAWVEHVGAHDAGCGNCDSPVDPTTWGSIKALYRR